MGVRSYQTYTITNTGTIRTYRTYIWRFWFLLVLAGSCWFLLVLVGVGGAYYCLFLQGVFIGKGMSFLPELRRRAFIYHFAHLFVFRLLLLLSLLFPFLLSFSILFLSFLFLYFCCPICLFTFLSMLNI